MTLFEWLEGGDWNDPDWFEHAEQVAGREGTDAGERANNDVPQLAKLLRDISRIGKWESLSKNVLSFH